MMGVGGYILSAAGGRWIWGEHDCCTFGAGWAVECGHADPMTFIRGDYDSELSALRRIQEGGGLVALWSRGMADAGVPEVGEDESLLAGDVGVVSRQTVDGVNEAVALWTGDMWATLGLNGIDCGPADALKVWRP